MNKTLLILILTLFVSLGTVWAHEGEHHEEGSTQETTAKESTVYACPMHPQIQKDKSGECSICGMKLEAKSSNLK